MNYNKLRKLAGGGRVQKFVVGGALMEDEIKQIMAENPTLTEDGAIEEYRKRHRFDSIPEISQSTSTLDPGKVSADISNLSLKSNGSISGGQIVTTKSDGTKSVRDIEKVNSTKPESKGLSTDAKGVIAGAAIQGVKAIDNALMGDKNFGAQSQAVDSLVHGASSALIKSGNPYAIAAGAALEGVNFLSKAGGKTTQGFDVDINSSGYGDMGHMASKSSRNWGMFLGPGLGELVNIGHDNKLEQQLKNRNEQAQMALKAANVSDTIRFEQEARMNSVDDTLRANEIALAGGIDTSLLSD